MADGVEINNTVPEMSNGASGTSTIFAKPFPDSAIFPSLDCIGYHE